MKSNLFLTFGLGCLISLSTISSAVRADDLQVNRLKRDSAVVLRSLASAFKTLSRSPTVSAVQTTARRSASLRTLIARLRRRTGQIGFSEETVIDRAIFAGNRLRCTLSAPYEKRVSSPVSLSVSEAQQLFKVRVPPKFPLMFVIRGEKVRQATTMQARLSRALTRLERRLRQTNISDARRAKLEDRRHDLRMLRGRIDDAANAMLQASATICGS